MKLYLCNNCGFLSTSCTLNVDACAIYDSKFILENGVQKEVHEKSYINEYDERMQTCNNCKSDTIIVIENVSEKVVKTLSTTDGVILTLEVMKEVLINVDLKDTKSPISVKHIIKSAMRD